MRMKISDGLTYTKSFNEQELIKASRMFDCIFNLIHRLNKFEIESMQLKSAYAVREDDGAKNQFRSRMTMFILCVDNSFHRFNAFIYSISLVAIISRDHFTSVHCHFCHYSKWILLSTVQRGKKKCAARRVSI